MSISILGTGLSGLVGTRVVELLRDEFSFQDLSLTSGVDITDYEQVIRRFDSSSPDIVLHMAAKTDVDGCEDDKLLGEEGDAWRINVTGTQNIVDAAKQFGKKIIYVSTDFVFDGTKKEAYDEGDFPNPVNWYAVTKYEGEQVVSNASIPYAIIRLSYPYRSEFASRTDFVRRIIEKASRKEKIFALTDHIFTPTFIDDFADALRTIFRQNLKGIYHVVGSEYLAPNEAIEKIFSVFQLQTEIVPVTRSFFFNHRAFRPCRLAINNDKITGLGAKMCTFDQGLEKMKIQRIPSKFAFN